MRVILTRPEPEAEDAVAELEARGHEVVRSPVLAVRLLEPPLPTGPFRAVLVTSANGARGLARLPGVDRLLDLPLVSVGRATAERARALGFRGAESGGEDAAALAEHLVVTMPQAGAPLLYAAGRDRQPGLERRLAQVGLAVVTLEVYAALPVPELTQEARRTLLSGDIDAVLHFSRRSAQAFLDAAERSGVLAQALGARHIAISQAAAEPLAAAGASHREVAIRPTLAGVIDALDTHRASRREAAAWQRRDPLAASPIGGDPMSIDDRTTASADPVPEPTTGGANVAGGTNVASGAKTSRRGLGVRAATLGALGGLVSGGLAVALYTLATDGASNRAGRDPTVAALRSRVEAVERGAGAGGNAAELAQRVAAAETARSELATRLTALEQRPVAAESAPQGSAPDDARLQALEARVADALKQMDTRVNEAAQRSGSQGDAAQVAALAPRLEEVSQQVSALGALNQRVEENARQIAQLGQVGGRVDEVARQVSGLAALAQRVEENGRRLGELENVRQRIAALEQTGQRVAAIEQRLRDQPLDRRAGLAVALAALQSAISRGASYATELATLERLNGAPDDRLAALRGRAQGGIPTAAALRQQFTSVSDEMADAQASSQADGALGRLLASAQSAVRVRQTGQVEGTGLGAVNARIRTALEEGNLRRALEEWRTLPDAARSASKEWGEALAARVQAEDAIGALATNLAAATAPAGNAPAASPQPAPAASPQPAPAASPQPAQ